MPSLVRIAVAFVILVVGACSQPGGPEPSGLGSGVLTIDDPATGSAVSASPVRVTGHAPAGSRVVRDVSLLSDDEVIANVDGTWAMEVELTEGANELVFRIGDDRSTQVKLGLTYRAAAMAPSAAASPPQASSGGTPSQPVPSPSATAAVTPVPTAIPTPQPSYLTISDGTYEVPGEVEPGTYRLREPSSFCYWARLKGFSGELEDIIANENLLDAYGVVTIGKSDKGFESNNCGEWSSDLTRVTPSTSQVDQDGTYIVKTDVAAGTWRATGGEFCYWARLKGFLRDPR